MPGTPQLRQFRTAKSAGLGAPCLRVVIQTPRRIYDSRCSPDSGFYACVYHRNRSGRPLFLLTESGGVYIQGTILIGISIASFRLAGKAAPIER